MQKSYLENDEDSEDCETGVEEDSCRQISDYESSVEECDHQGSDGESTEVCHDQPTSDIVYRRLGELEEKKLFRSSTNSESECDDNFAKSNSQSNLCYVHGVMSTPGEDYFKTRKTNNGGSLDFESDKATAEDKAKDAAANCAISSLCLATPEQKKLSLANPRTDLTKLQLNQANTQTQNSDLVQVYDENRVAHLPDMMEASGDGSNTKSCKYPTLKHAITADASSLYVTHRDTYEVVIMPGSRMFLTTKRPLENDNNNKNSNVLTNSSSSQTTREPAMTDSILVTNCTDEPEPVDKSWFARYQTRTSNRNCQAELLPHTVIDATDISNQPAAINCLPVPVCKTEPEDDKSWFVNQLPHFENAFLNGVEESEDEPEILTCEKCGVTFNSTKFLLRHKRHHGVEMDLNECHKCGALFPNKISLTLHRKVHMQNYRSNWFKSRSKLYPGVRPFTCLDCDALFVTEMAWKRHCVVHGTTDKWYTCFDCGKSFVYPELAKVHSRLVHGRRQEETPDSVATSSHNLRAD